jgi:hypothetical protein
MMNTFEIISILRYVALVVAGILYARQYILTLSLDIARGAPFILLGFHELAYLTCRLADVNLVGAQCVTVVTLFSLWLTRRRNFPYFSTLFCILYLANSPNRLYFILELVFALSGIRLARWISGVAQGVFGVQPHSIIYFVYRANIGYTGLETDTEKLIYELPFLILHYVCVYWKETPSISS